MSTSSRFIVKKFLYTSELESKINLRFFLSLGSTKRMKDPHILVDRCASCKTQVGSLFHAKLVATSQLGSYYVHDLCNMQGRLMARLSSLAHLTFKMLFSCFAGQSWCHHTSTKLSIQLSRFILGTTLPQRDIGQRKSLQHKTIRIEQSHQP